MAGERTHVELHWHLPKGSQLAVARLLLGRDADLVQVVATLSCPAEHMSRLDRVLQEGAANMQNVTYLGRKLEEGELW